MSGYRQHSFDPNAFAQPGAPLRPYDWVQWTGVALEVVAIGLFLAHLAGKVGWIAPPPFTNSPGLALMLVGVVLINSRRSPSTLVTPEQQARNKRSLAITVAVCAAILGLAAAIEFTGA